MTDKKIKNLSLNLVATQPTIDFSDTGIALYNTVSGPVQRFEFVADSSAVPPLVSTKTRTQVMAGQADSIRGLQGFTLAPTPTIRGVGAKCVSGESGCIIAADGQPAWLIASVSYTAILPASTTELFLQVGEHGINHETVLAGDHDFNSVVERADHDLWKASFGSSAAAFADSNNNGVVDAADFVMWRNNFDGVGVVEPTNLTTVRFGIGPITGVPEPIYNAATDRQMNFTTDHADAVIQVAGPGSGTVASISAVPEPTSLFPFLAGCLIMATRQRSARRSTGYW